MSPEDMEKMATIVAKKISAIDEREHPRCQCPAGNERHYQHHQLLDKVVGVMDRLIEIKWGVARALAIIMVVSICGIFLLGAGVKLKELIVP